MITRILIDLLVTVPTWILAHLPAVSFPDYLTTTGSNSLYGVIHGAKDSIYQVDYWLPVAQIEAAAALVLLALVSGVGMKVFRVIASFLTLGGGSAA